MTRIIETDAEGRLILPAEVLGDAKPHSKFVVEEDGSKLGIYPESATLAKNKMMTPEEWETHWQTAQREMAKVWPKGLSAAEVISEMRR